MKVKNKSEHNNSSTIEFDLPLIIFKEEGATICYCPSLDLSGYGHNEKEAIASYKYSLNEYLDYTAENHTLLQDQQRLGWLVKNNINRSLIPPPMTKLLQHNDNFKRVFEKFDYYWK